MAEAARQLSLFLLLFVVGDVFCVKVVHVETGENYTFKSSVSGTPQTILWKFQKNKVVEHESDGYSWYKFEDRAALNIQTGDFTLTQLSKEDSGHYESEIQVDGKLQYSYHDIEVIDAVPVPEVTCHANSTGATLECSVGSSVQAQFEWVGPNNLKKMGERISVPFEEQSVYICTAQNKVGKKSTEFYLTKCNTDGSGVPLAAILGPLIIVLIGCGVAGSVLLYRRKQGKYEAVKTEEAKKDLDEHEITSEINERSNGDLSTKDPDRQGDESKKSTDEHMKMDELHPEESSSQQNEDKKSQETFLKPESNSVENNKPSEEEEQMPENKDKNTLKTDAEPQTQDSDEKGQSDEQLVAEEDKEKKEQQDDIMDERATPLFYGEKSPPAEPTDLEERQPENKDDCSGNIEGVGVCVEDKGNYSEEKQENAGQNPEESQLVAANGQENAQTDNNGEPSSSTADKDQSVKKEGDRGKDY